jgi:hypothetical protein
MITLKSVIQFSADTLSKLSDNKRRLAVRLMLVLGTNIS